MSQRAGARARSTSWLQNLLIVLLLTELVWATSALSQVPTSSPPPNGEIGPVRPASQAEVEQMISEVKRRMIPFTLAEAHSGQFAEQGNRGLMQMPDVELNALTVKRLENDKSLSVTALTIRKNESGSVGPGSQSGKGPLLEVSFFLKEGFASWAMGDAGPEILDLREPTTVTAENAIGFRVVVLVDDDMSTGFLEHDGAWVVKKFKGDPPKDWPL